MVDLKLGKHDADDNSTAYWHDHDLLYDVLEDESDVGFCDVWLGVYRERDCGGGYTIGTWNRLRLFAYLVHTSARYP